jgi:hypothetical protein
MSSTSLLNLILSNLRSGPKSAREIAANVGSTKTEVNSILYKNRDLFSFTTNTPPMWSLISNTSSSPIRDSTEIYDLTNWPSEYTPTVIGWKLHKLISDIPKGRRSHVTLILGTESIFDDLISLMQDEGIMNIERK